MEILYFIAGLIIGDTVGVILICLLIANQKDDEPNQVEMANGIPLCPVCGCEARRWYSFCPDCGAKLDHSKKQEDAMDERSEE